MKNAPYSLSAGRFFCLPVGARLAGEGYFQDAIAGQPCSYSGNGVTRVTN
ncbi:hypothetical protein [Pseudomonas sp. NPDC089569]